MINSLAVLEYLIILFANMLLMFSFSTKAAAQEIVIQDIFGRSLNGQQIVLVDWEGQIANPAIELTIIPPEGASFPATATLSANGDRLYFDSPDDPIFSTLSLVGSSGPTRIIDFPNSNPQSFYLSIFPDRDVLDESYTLNIDFVDGSNSNFSESVDINVIDQDMNRLSNFNITVDISQDQTGFFSDPEFGQHRKDIVQQAADDWAYFVGNMNLDQVDVLTELTFIWDSNGEFIIGNFVENTFSYTGFLLYPYGVDSAMPPFRSGGAPSLHAFQTSSNGSIIFPLRRSGTCEVEIKGNFNTLGWFLTSGDSDWWTSANIDSEQNDLYSIVHHEIGHALFANSGYPNFEAAELSCSCFNNADIVSYHGTNVKIDLFDHFQGEIDNASLRGAYGNEYFGGVPSRRWLVTKLDLLILEAVGYQLRDTSPLEPLSIVTTDLPDAVINSVVQNSLLVSREFYSQKILVSGGIPFYNWSVVDGVLPDGLSLDSFTGVISGTPTQTGNFTFTVNVRDYSKTGAGVNQTLTIGGNNFQPGDANGDI